MRALSFMARGQGVEQEREIWFARILWSYMPIHWKGWLLLLFAVLVGNGAIWVAHLGFHDNPIALGALAVFILADFIWLFWVTERHSKPRR